MSKRREDQTSLDAASTGIDQPSLADCLRQKRLGIIREADRRRKILDRVIAKLEATEAESVISEAQEALVDA